MDKTQPTKKVVSAVVVDIYNIPKKTEENKKINNLPIISAPDAIWAVWNREVNKLYVPAGGIPGYNIEMVASKYGVKIEKY